MGWLKELLGRGESSLLKETIPFAEIHTWLDLQGQSLIAEAKLEEELAQYFEALQAKRWHFEVKLEEWKKVDVPRESFSRFRSFLQGVHSLHHHLSVKERPDLFQTLDWNKELEQELTQVKNLLDSFDQEGFTFLLAENQDAEKAIFTPFARELQQMEELRKAFEQKVVQARLRTLEVLQSKRDFLETTNLHLIQLEKRLTALQQRLELAQTKRQEKAEEMGSLNQLPAATVYHQLGMQRKLHHQKIAQHQDKVVAFFSKLKPPFEAASPLLDEKDLLKEYVQDPENAFLHDEGLRILSLVQQVRGLVIDNKVSLTPEITKAFLDLVAKADRGYLNELQQERRELQQESARIAPPPSDRPFLLKLEEAQYRLEHFTQQVTQLQQQISEAEEQMKELKEQRSKELDLFLHLIKMGLGKEIEVVL